MAKTRNHPEFEVNYDKKTLKVFFEDTAYTFDLTKGDVGDYWFGFELVDGTIKDVNFYQETHEERPSVCLYGVKDGQIDMSDEILITDYTSFGDTKNYFPWPTKAEDQARIDEMNKKRPDSHHLDKLIEIWSFSFNGVWYEVHVDATQDRTITQTFAEYGEVTPDIMKHLEEEVSKIDNI